MSDDPIQPFAPSRRSEGTPIACIACPPHNVEMRVTNIHPGPNCLYVHLVCSNGHPQRFAVRVTEDRVLIEMVPSPMSNPPRPGETVH